MLLLKFEVNPGALTGSELGEGGHEETEDMRLTGGFRGWLLDVNTSVNLKVLGLTLNFSVQHEKRVLGHSYVC
jgi:hypothetical protein